MMADSTLKIEIIAEEQGVSSIELTDKHCTAGKIEPDHL